MERTMYSAIQMKRSIPMQDSLSYSLNCGIALGLEEVLDLISK